MQALTRDIKGQRKIERKKSLRVVKSRERERQVRPWLGGRRNGGIGDRELYLMGRSDRSNIENEKRGICYPGGV